MVIYTGETPGARPQIYHREALEKKLMEAERALYGFRAIFNNYRAITEEEAKEESSSDVQRMVGEDDGRCAIRSPEECED